MKRLQIFERQALLLQNKRKQSNGIRTFAHWKVGILVCFHQRDQKFEFVATGCIGGNLSQQFADLRQRCFVIRFCFYGPNVDRLR